MDKETAEAIGLLRHQIISPVLMESERSQMKYFITQSEKEFDVPRKGFRRFKPNTMKTWLHRYKKHGFSAITPTARADKNGYRKISPELIIKLKELRREWPELSVPMFYKKCLEKNILSTPPQCMATIRRFLLQNKMAKSTSVEVRKRYEMGSFGELFVGDYMHGPQVLVGKMKKKAILFAIIDDHSRMIVGHDFALNENTIAIEKVFKEAILIYGLPLKIYLDNGASFSSHYLARVCAHLNVALVHSKPYDSPSRGKIERFFRTVRECFLAGIRPDEELTLEGINERFRIWLRDDYHRKIHSGINARPIDRYTMSITKHPRPLVDPEVLNEHFMVSGKRLVKKDSTISYEAKIYEVPSRFIGQDIEIRHLQDAPKELFLYENGERVALLKQVDAVENGKIFRPLRVEQLSLSDKLPQGGVL